VLAQPRAVPGLARVLASETGTLGWRQHEVGRWATAREFVEVEVGGQRIRVKVGPYRLKAEYDDCAVAARCLGLPLSEVAIRAERSAAEKQGSGAVE
jgi:uncharacterized protein (DUF111 family)